MKGPDPEVLDAVVELFFERIQPYSSGRLVFPLDRPLTDRAAAPLPVAESNHFAARGRDVGATAVDMAPAYAGHAARSTLTLAVGSSDWHPNRLGVQLLAGEAAGGLARAVLWQPPSR